MLNDYLKSPRDVRLELAGRAKAERLRQNLTQEALAHAAGISLSTLRRFEKTGDIALASFVEIAFALRRMDGFDALFPEPPVHSLFEAAPRERKRARRPDASEVYLNARGERRFVGLLEERGGDILFEYDKRFLDSGIELSPFLLPLRPGVASDPKRTFDGLFGVFNDSLPDGWGLLLLDRLLRRSGLPLERITPLSRLSLVGSGGMGALEYEPVTPDPDPLPERIDLDGVAEEAWRTLNEDPLPVETLRTLMALNGSSCGARPKIMVRVSGDRRLIVPDAVAEPGCDPWLIKFPARHDDPAIGRMEYACSLAAKRAGIEMPETALFPGRDGAAYFGVRRFDREDGGKVHVHTACGLLHASHRYASLDYENLFRLGKSLTRNPEDVEKLVRLMAFNVRLGNQDDHSKNFSFLLDAKGRWRLAPAYDLTPSRGVGGEQTCMVNGKGRDITDKDMIAAASVVDVPARTVKAILEQVGEAVAALPAILAEVSG